MFLFSIILYLRHWIFNTHILHTHVILMTILKNKIVKLMCAAAVAAHVFELLGFSVFDINLIMMIIILLLL